MYSLSSLWEIWNKIIVQNYDEVDVELWMIYVENGCCHSAKHSHAKTWSWGWVKWEEEEGFSIVRVRRKNLKHL